MLALLAQRVSLRGRSNQQSQRVARLEMESGTSQAEPGIFPQAEAEFYSSSVFLCPHTWLGTCGERVARRPPPPRRCLFRTQSDRVAPARIEARSSGTDVAGRDE